MISDEKIIIYWNRVRSGQFGSLHEQNNPAGYFCIRGKSWRDGQEDDGDV